jgi:predicted histone-like DNA-binding protein
MSVKYNVVARKNPSNPEAPKKYYPSIVSSGRTTLRQLAQEISKISTLGSADTMAILEALLMVIPSELAKGNIVELGDFGNFWLKSNSGGVDTPEVVRANQINKILPRFNPGKEFKKVIDAIEFKKA